MTIATRRQLVRLRNQPWFRIAVLLAISALAWLMLSSCARLGVQIAKSLR